MNQKQEDERPGPLYYDSEAKQLNTRERDLHSVFDVLNQRWTLLVLKHLSTETHRFNELCKLTSINPNTLRDRLRDLERFGVVERQVISAMPPNVEYRLSARGKELHLILGQLDKWMEQNAAVELESPTVMNSKV